MLKIIGKAINFGAACWFCWTIGNVIYEAGKEAQRKEDSNSKNDIPHSETVSGYRIIDGDFYKKVN